MDIKIWLEGQNCLFRTKGAICTGLYNCFLSYVPCCCSGRVGQKYSRLRCLLRVKGLVNCFYLGWSGSILQFRQNIVKVGSKSWLLTCSSNITLSLPSYTGSALKSELNFCNSYLSLLYFWSRAYFPCILACISGQLLLSKLQICVKLNISLLGIINYLMHTKYILEFAVRNCNSRRIINF